MYLALALLVGSQVFACNEQIVDGSEESGLPPEVERYIEARCERVLSCDCDSVSFDSQDTCFDALAATYLAVEAERSIQLECFDAVASSWERTGCEGAVAEPCAPYENSQQVGAPCEPYRFGDFNFVEEDCAEGLVCWLGSCVPFEPADADDPCPESDYCGAGLYCEQDTCVVRGSEGDACDDDFECDPSLNCAGGMCVPAGGSGDACGVTTDCASPYQCISAACVEIQHLACFAAIF